MALEHHSGPSGHGGSRALTSPRRQCPLCQTVGSLSSSHRRNSHETFLAVIAPFAHPFRCSACNWRGMMGRVPFVRHSKLNLFLNGLLYYIFLVLVITALAEWRARLHPMSLLEPDFVLPDFVGITFGRELLEAAPDLIPT